MATLTYPKKTALPFNAPTSRDCVDCGNNDYCQPIIGSDPLSFQTVVNPSETSVAFDMADFTGTNWAVSNGVLTHTAGSTTAATLAGIFTVGRRYRIKFQTSNITTGTIDIRYGDSGSSSSLLAIGNNYNFYFSASATVTTNLTIVPTIAFDGSIEILSITDITDLRYGLNDLAINGDFDTSDSWVGGTDWSYAAGVWTKVAGAASLLYQSDTTNTKIKLGKSYRVTAGITRSAGNIRMFIGNPNLSGGTVSYGRRQAATGTLSFFGHLDVNNDPAVDYVIGFETDTTFAGTIDWIEIYELAEDAYKIFNCDTDAEIGDIPEEFIDRVTDTRTLVQMTSFSGGVSGDLVTDGTFDTPLATGTATGDAGAQFTDSTANFTALNLQGDNLVHNITDDTWSYISTIDSATQITTASAIIATGEEYEIYVWSDVNNSGAWAIDSDGIYPTTTTDPIIELADVVDGTQYLVRLTVVNRVHGTITPYLGIGAGTAISENGTFTETITAGSGGFVGLYPSVDFDGNISLFQVYEVLPDGCYKICSYRRYGTAQDTNVIPADASRFDVSTGWLVTGAFSIGSGVATKAAGSSGNLRWNTDVFTDGVEYTVTFDTVITIPSLSGVTLFMTTSAGVNTTQIINYTTSGTYSVTFTGVTATPRLTFVGSDAASNFTIDNVVIGVSFDDVFTQDECTPCLCLDDWEDCTLLLSWTNEDDAFGLDYTSSSFTQYMRVAAEVRFSAFPNDRTMYVDSNGTNRLVVGSVREEEELYIAPAPRYVHQAISLGLNHDTFYIDGTEYVMPEGQYEPTRDRTTLLQEAIVPIEEATQDFFNGNC